LLLANSASTIPSPLILASFLLGVNEHAHLQSGKQQVRTSAHIPQQPSDFDNLTTTLPLIPRLTTD
jgi:hypothetical protein